MAEPNPVDALIVHPDDVASAQLAFDAAKTPAEQMETFARLVEARKAEGQETYPPGGAIGRWVQVSLEGGDRLAHMSIVVDPATPTVVDKYVAVVYVEPNASARYARGESLYSFDEALQRAAGLMKSMSGAVVEDY